MPAATDDKPARSHAEREATSVFRRYDVAPTEANLATFAAYRARTRRARWCGVLGAVVVGGVGWLGSANQSGDLLLVRLLMGYLVGSAAAELFSPQRLAEGVVHTATLSPRQPHHLMPLWARVMPWLFLLPCLAAPLLLVGDHFTGVTRVHDHMGSSMATASWFSDATLYSIAIFAVGGLIVWRLALTQLTQRRLPADSHGAARLDVLTRALSAQTVSGTAAALGLALLGSLANLSSEPLVSMTCTAVSNCHYLYGLHAHYDLIQTLGGVAWWAAFILFLVSRRPRGIDPDLLERAAKSSK
jgi:hypothetical protein